MQGRLHITQTTGVAYTNTYMHVLVLSFYITWHALLLFSNYNKNSTTRLRPYKTFNLRCKCATFSGARTPRNSMRRNIEICFLQGQMKHLLRAISFDWEGSSYDTAKTKVLCCSRCCTITEVSLLKSISAEVLAKFSRPLPKISTRSCVFNHFERERKTVCNQSFNPKLFTVYKNAQFDVIQKSTCFIIYYIGF